MIEESKNIIDKINSNRAKIYYQLNQLEEITGMSPRTLKYRMKLVKEKYSNIPSLLKRNGKAWQIHYTLIDEFLPKYNKKQSNLTNHKWETIMTWNTKDSYDINYHVQLIKEVKQKLPSVNIGYVIETDGRGVSHLHAITDGFKDNVEIAVSGILNKYIDSGQYRCQIEKINNYGSITSYLKKSGEITII
ncbi:hypothetical protein [Flavobacterium sp. UBA7680]|uniref:hypothetical protein n=1 Tax=Flavobacterium sp. UBA7680 TaxID=1946559 RepID=UPI0025C048E7|nr:hypothetical protein [Flavobacterium sp. UBA7680]